jgi:hypothetical protein
VARTMIAAQMLAYHDASMGCFRYALAANKTSGLFRDYLNQAGKLSRAFAMLLDALNRHRGKGQQKIAVEHVHVHTGGQAVVGVVEAPGGRGSAEIGGSTPWIKSECQCFSPHFSNGKIGLALTVHIQSLDRAPGRGPQF